MFETLFQKIEAHPTYSANLRGAIEAGETLVLNYHTHGDPNVWCTSICVEEPEILDFIGQLEGKSKSGGLRELAHIKGLGRGEDDCIPLMGTLGAELIEHYGLASAPLIYKNGVSIMNDPSAGGGEAQDGGDA